MRDKVQPAEPLAATMLAADLLARQEAQEARRGAREELQDQQAELRAAELAAWSSQRE